MKKCILIGAACLLTGCAGLNVSWSLVATYKTPHATPGAPVPAEQSTEQKK